MAGVDVEATSRAEVNHAGAGPAGGMADTAPSPLVPAHVVAAVLALFVATDYKFRKRPLEEAVSGTPDVFILFELGIYALVTVALLTVFGRLPVRTAALGAPARWLLAFTGVAVVSVLWSPYPTLAAVRAGQLVIVVAATLVLARHGGRAAMHAVAHGFVVLTTVSVFLGVVFPFDYTLLSNLVEPVPRFSWFVVHPVVAGVYLATAIILAMGYARRAAAGRRWPTSVYWACAAICGVALGATRTRASLGAAIVGLVVLLALSVRRVRWLDIAVAACLALVLVGIVASDTILEFVQRDQSAEEITTLSTRTELWSEALAATTETPFAGFGLQAARALFYETSGLGGGHNALINVLVELGLVGTFCWAAVLVTTAVAIRRLWRETELRTELSTLTALGVAHLLNAITYEGLGSVLNVALLWLLLVVAWVEILRRSAAT